MHQLPNEFLARMAEITGSEYEAFLLALQQPAPTSIRLNGRKPHGPEGSPVPWCSAGRYLPQRPSFTLDPAFHQGCYYVQEASSMFLESAVRQLVNTEAPITALDGCAAPGGKTTHLLDLLHPESLVVANEVIRSRIPQLTSNLTKWGRSNVAVTSSDPSAFEKLGGFFDLILVDAPCSGEGLFRRDASAAQEWSPDNTALCSARQRRILESYWPSLKENGILLYSTCTWNPQEDELNLARFAESHQAEPVQLEFDQTWGIAAVNTGCKFFPHRLAGEGFFIGALRKKGQAEDVPFRRKRSPDQMLPDAQLNNLLVQPERFSFRSGSYGICADVRDHLPLLTVLQEHLHVVRSGIAIGQMKGNRLIPEHDLALSCDLIPDAFAVEELDRQDALTYLRKDNLHLKGSGITRVSYEGHGLGWANILPGRTNNLLPAAWRIRMESSF